MLQVKKLTSRDLTCHKTGLPVASADGTSATAGEGGRGGDWRSGGGRLPAPANSGEGGGGPAAQLELDPSRDQLVFEGDTLRLRCRLLAQPLHQEAVLR
jgi:hypothetical protein